MATINKRGNTFQIVVSLGLDVNGKKIRKTTTYKPPENTTPKKAEKLAQEFAVEFERKCRGLSSLNENMRFSEMAEWFIDNYAKNKLKPITAYNYEKQIKNNLLPELGNIKLKDFTPAKITAFFKTRTYQPATCRKVYVILQSVFARAVEQGFIKETPCTKAVILPKAETAKEKKPFLDENQAKALLKMVDDNTQFNRIIKVLLYTGMRSGECLALRWQDIDFENKSFIVSKSMFYQNRNTWQINPTKTAAGTRLIYLDDTTIELLQEWRTHQAKVGQISFIFSYNCLPITKTMLVKAIKVHSECAGVKSIRIHDLRHSHASFLLSLGMNDLEIQNRLGHADVRTTLRTYSHLRPNAMREVADKLEGQIKFI